MGAYSACKALVVGVGRYADPQYDLGYARSDAEAMAELLEGELAGLLVAAWIGLTVKTRKRIRRSQDDGDRP